MTSHTKLNFAPETIKTLSEHPNIIGFKDSSGDVIYFQKVLSLLKDRPDFPVFVGPEEILMQTMLSGGHGGVNGRSEEHTSELQSRGHLVCRLLLEKKKQKERSHATPPNEE